MSLPPCSAASEHPYAHLSPVLFHCVGYTGLASMRQMRLTPFFVLIDVGRVVHMCLMLHRMQHKAQPEISAHAIATRTSKSMQTACSNAHLNGHAGLRETRQLRHIPSLRVELRGERPGLLGGWFTRNQVFVEAAEPELS